MKKVFTVIMCILMLLLIAGCGSKNKVRKMPPENNYAGHTSEKNYQTDETEDKDESSIKSTSAVSTKAESKTTETTTKGKPDKVNSKSQFLTATEDDFKKLGVKFFDEKTWLFYNGEMLHTCDFEKMNPKTFFDEIFSCGSGWSTLYEYYFGEIRSIEYSNKADPKGRFKVNPGEERDNNTGCYFKYNADKVDWIMKNIFNITPNRNCKFSDSRNYYYDGYYYIAENSGYGGGDYSYRVKNHKQLSDGKYEIYLEIMYAGDKEVDDAGKMVAALKNVDGKRVWSFYSMNII